MMRAVFAVGVVLFTLASWASDSPDRSGLCMLAAFVCAGGVAFA